MILQSDHGPETEIPDVEQIKIPLLRVINDMGGQVELSLALPQISQHFNIRVKHPDNDILSPTGQEIYRRMGFAANLLWIDNCLKRVAFNTWEITVGGIELLQGSYKIGCQPDSSSLSQSSKLSESSKKSLTRPLQSVRSKEIESLDVESIKIPLLRVINDMGGQVELSRALPQIAQYFDIRVEQTDNNTLSLTAQELLKRMGFAANLLWIDNCLKRMAFNTWEITVAGIELLQGSHQIPNQLHNSFNSQSSAAPRDSEQLFRTQSQAIKSQSSLSSPKPSTDVQDKVFKAYFGFKSANSSGEPSTPSHPPPLLPESVSALDRPLREDHNKKIQIPSSDEIRIPLLSTIYEMGGEVELCQVTERIAEYFGIPVEEISDCNLSPVEERLFEAMHDSAKLLRFDNFLEPSSLNFWKITAKGLQKLGITNRIQDQAGFTAQSKSANSLEETSSRSQPKKLVWGAVAEPTLHSSTDQDTKIQIPSVGQIQIPLLKVIYQSGGQVDLSHTVDGVAKHFCVPNDRRGDGTFCDAAQRLFGLIQLATNILRAKGYVTQTKPGFWEITAKGIANLGSLNLARDAETKFHSTLSNSPQEEPNVEDPSSKSKSQQTVSKNELQNARSDTTDFGLDAIPSPNRIRIPLLYTIYVMGREIQLFQATEKIAEHFDIPTKYLGKNPSSSIEKRLFEAMQNAADLLRIEKYLERSRLDYCKITDAGINWLKSSKKLD